jgi:hypothetical protein
LLIVHPFITFVTFLLVAAVKFACKDAKPVKVCLKTIYCNGGSKYLGVAVEESEKHGLKTLFALRERIGKQLKLKTDDGWSPHTTVAQCSQEDAKEKVEELQKDFEKVEFEVREIAILHKDDKGRYKALATVALG